MCQESYLELARSRGVCSARIGRCLKWLQSYMGEQLETIKLQVTDVVSNSLVFVWYRSEEIHHSQQCRKASGSRSSMADGQHFSLPGLWLLHYNFSFSSGPSIFRVPPMSQLGLSVTTWHLLVQPMSGWKEPRSIHQMNEWRSESS